MIRTRVQKLIWLTSYFYFVTENCKTHYLNTSPAVNTKCWCVLPRRAVHVYYKKKVILSEVKPLTQISNKSFETGIVPDTMKVATVIPLFKSGDKDAIINCMLVSPSLFPCTTVYKLAKTIWIMYRYRYILNVTSATMLYSSYWWPIGDYCFDIWGTQIVLTCAFPFLQKRVVRMILGEKTEDNFNILFGELNVFK